MQLSLINLKEDEVDSLRTYIEQHLESTVGYWTEEEVEKKALEWRVSLQAPTPSPNDDDNDNNDDENKDNNHDEIIKEKRTSAKNRIEGLSSLDEAKRLLIKLCDGGNESILDTINM